MTYLILISSSFSKKEDVFAELDKHKIETLLSTGEVHFDWLVEYSKDRAIPLLTNFAKYKVDGKYDEGASLKNKLESIKLADRIIAWWDKEGKGVGKALVIAKRLKKPTKVITFASPLAGYYIFSGNVHMFSLDYPQAYTVGGREFGTARQALAFFSAVKLGLKQLAAEILELDMTKKTARPRLTEIWSNQVCLPDLDPHLEKLLYLILLPKFQDEALKKFLVDTKGAIVWAAEDTLLGCGYLKTDPGLYEVEKWGKNLLGRALDKVRTKFNEAKHD